MTHGKTIRNEEALDNFTRGMVYGFIKANPGVHYSAIKKELDLNNGSILYHLEVLENKGFVRSETDGAYRRFYSTSAPPGGRFLSVPEKMIVDEVGQSPGCIQRDLAASLGMSPRNINYYIKKLSAVNLLKVERRGRITQCYPV